jgi:small subunit ribosomal protein S6e
MVEFKIILGHKSGKCAQREVKDDEADFFVGKKIGDTVEGVNFGLEGYECIVTGGSNSAGFPMRRDVYGAGKKKILAVKGTGIKKKRDGQKQRKTVCGNTIDKNIAQINLKIVKEGKEKLFEEPAPETPAKGDAPSEVPKEVAPAEEKK